MSDEDLEPFLPPAEKKLLKIRHHTDLVRISYNSEHLVVPGTRLSNGHWFSSIVLESTNPRDRNVNNLGQPLADVRGDQETIHWERAVWACRMLISWNRGRTRSQSRAKSAYVNVALPVLCTRSTILEIHFATVLSILACSDDISVRARWVFRDK